MKIKPFKAIYPNLEMISSPKVFFGTVKYDYTDFVKSGFFSHRPKKALYVYQITNQFGIQTGIVAALDIQDVINNKVKKHENTLAHKEQRMTHLLIERNAMIKPVLIGFPSKNRELGDYVYNIIENKEAYFNIEFEEDCETHRFWEIVEPKRVKKIVKLFKKNVPNSYIADGHHRCSTTTKLYNSGRINTSDNDQSILVAFFSFDELNIHDFNRVIDLFHDVDPTLFGIKLSKYCDISPLKKAKSPKKKHHFHMCIKGDWYKLKWKKSILKKYHKDLVILDVNLFNHYVLEKILNVPDVREDRRIIYVEGTLGQSEIEKKVRADNNLVGFSFFPITANEIMTVADANSILPPKSTYFEPRIKNGLIVKSF